VAGPIVRYGKLRLPQPSVKPFVDEHRTAFIGRDLDAAKLRTFEDDLEFARENDWRVIGFVPPFSSESLRALRRDPRTRGLLRAFEQRMPRVFADHGYAFLNLLRASSVPCGEDEFMYDDGGHADPACGRKLRARLDNAAALAAD
jgi:hypothetical protein